MEARLMPLMAACMCILIVAGSSGQAQVRRFVPVTDAVLQNPDPADWLNWRRTLDGWGHSPLDQIHKGNVAKLQLAWSWTIEPGAFQTTPVVHDGVMYLANPGSVIQALDARTGDLIWEYRRKLRSTGQLRNLAIYEDLILVNTVDGHIVALDAQSGAERWDTPLGGAAGSGPIIANGTAITGVGAARGAIAAFDARTGKEVWRISTIAGPDEPGGDTWNGLAPKLRVGGNAWMPGTFDPINNTTFWGTAQAKPWARAARGTGDAEELYAASTMALDPATGKLKWYFQHFRGDSHDMDEVFERILIDHDGKSSVFTMGKLGILWELDRKTGRFVHATDLGYQNLVDLNPKTGRLTYRPGMLPVIGKETFFCPVVGGFKSLRAMAYHPQTKAFYVPLCLACETGTFMPVERKEDDASGGDIANRKKSFHPKSLGQLGEFLAMRAATGEVMWRQRRATPFSTAALTTGGGLVFVGDWDRFVFAYDAETGEQLWQTRLALMTNGFPITYAVNGKQYVAVSAGASIGQSNWMDILPRALVPEKRNPRVGNGIYVFALP